MTALRRTVALIAVAFGLILTALSGVAIAAPVSGEAYVRLAHLSPDTPNVDVYVASVADPSSSFVVPGVGYGAVSPYRALPVGSYVVSMRVAGAPADSPAVISASVDARSGGAYTVAGVGMSAVLGLSVLTDRLAIPPAGSASVRVINGAGSAPTVDIAPAGGRTWASDVAFATATAYVDVPLGTWNLQVTVPGKAPVLLPSQLDVNSVYTVLLVDTSGGLKAQLLRDSTGSDIVPVGGVETGSGGTAAPDPALLVGCGMAAALGGGLLAVRVGAQRAGGRVH